MNIDVIANVVVNIIHINVIIAIVIIFCNMAASFTTVNSINHVHFIVM